MPQRQTLHRNQFNALEAQAGWHCSKGSEMCLSVPFPFTCGLMFHASHVMTIHAPSPDSPSSLASPSPSPSSSGMALVVPEHCSGYGWFWWIMAGYGWCLPLPVMLGYGWLHPLLRNHGCNSQSGYHILRCTNITPSHSHVLPSQP